MKHFFSYLLIASCLCTSCGSSSKKQDSTTRMANAPTENTQQGPQRMQTSEITEEFDYKGKHYQAYVLRIADEALPLVTNDEQQQFVDNRISVKLTCQGKNILSRTFTKADFQGLVDARFAKQAILEGIVFYDTNEQGICLAASLGHPESDLYQPIKLVVTPSGQLSMTLEEDMMDEVTLHESDNQ